ncbi:nicotinate-nucleotide--dimethylbenzimidazole phosphoribosyltransferase [Limimaricola cinnabarinus]|uniref:Nicotinate-nucleotide--dimethylbenzimidazole phosphoribosyltransferase n=1 Tax=Limimaricola cinnabarinus LL-001 TaxID=1337093 RepID=U3AH22_9RHOB|nr:nicotinate-nucleotide--dimethylbenzimidazole phosphoribosyltransferase [Limimaricola cinnabarinus]GAD54093.1 nicotinate-nucleotide--dimethylbenzimidazole phosphoribosyltransferase [Limimaricola cinnabarinus LL-001]
MTAPFSDLAGLRARLCDLPQPDAVATGDAQSRNAQLTKPAGALGRLEDLAIWYAGWRGDARPRLIRPQVTVFAGNHGVVTRGVSAFPAAVTAQMVGNFDAGGAAVNQLAEAFGATMTVHPIELDRPTADFVETPAMSEADLVAAMALGWAAVNPEADLLVAGEMGIGNTCSASAIAMALEGGAALDWTGRGTGVDNPGLARKVDAVTRGVARIEGEADPIEVLRQLGGREIAAMAGAILAARHHRIPVILDGFICCAAALVLHRAAPGVLDHAVAGHQSAESAHARLLEAMGKAPLLSLGLRLGEGSGAVLAIGVLKGALACHSGMASFAEAGVSDG